MHIDPAVSYMFTGPGRCIQSNRADHYINYLAPDGYLYQYARHVSFDKMDATHAQRPHVFLSKAYNTLYMTNLKKKF